MADIPQDTYRTTVNNPGNNWVNGVLNTKDTPPNSPKYKGVDVASGYSLDEADVHWSVTLRNEGKDCVVDFTGGVYDRLTKKIRGLRVTITCAGFKGPAAGDDGWSAEASTLPAGKTSDISGY